MISIILASGQGLRMRPLSAYIPKVLLPVRGKPVLDYILTNLKGLNIETNYIDVSELKETIDRYLKQAKLDNCKTVRGLEWESGGDLAVALESINPTGDVVVANGDTVTDVSMHDVYNDHLSEGGYLTIAITKMEAEKAKRFGRVERKDAGRPLLVTKFSEKAESGSLDVNMGLYVLDRKLVRERHQYLPPRRFKTELELFPRLVGEQKLFATNRPVSFYWDVGTMESYLEAEDNLR